MNEQEDSETGGAADAAGTQPLAEALSEHLGEAQSASERRTIAGLVREIGKLPAERARVVLEVSAGLAGLSLRVGVEFLRAASVAAQVLEAAELREWGQMGRRLAMADVETGVNFFKAGVGELLEVPPAARTLLFQVCARQLPLSTSIATETFRSAPELARATGADGELLAATFEVALEIARRSARHSADFLASSPAAFAHLEKYRMAATHDDVTQNDEADAADAGQARATHDEQAANEEGAARSQAASDGVANNEVARAALHLAGVFAQRAGGVAADAWAHLPAATNGLDAEQTRTLFRHTEGFLERGGAAALHVFIAGGEVLRLAPRVFADWTALLHTVAAQGNAPLVSLARHSPLFFRALPMQEARERRAGELARRVIAATRAVAEVDAEAAISCFRSAPSALRAASLEQFEQWAQDGLALKRNDARARRSYYGLETRQSNAALVQGGAGLALDEVAPTLRLYVEGLTGRAVDVASLAAVPDESRIGDGRTIHLPASVAEFPDDERNFRLYKVLAAHAAGQIEFGTHARAGQDDDTAASLRAAYASIAELYAEENADARDAFALDGYINDPATSEPALAPEEEARRARQARRRMPKDADYRAALALFPLPVLAARIFGTLENGRIDRRLRLAYRGLTRDLDLVRAHLRTSRPRIATVPLTLVPFELLFQITLCGGALDDARAFYSQIVSELETIVADYLNGATATVADTLMATSRVYTLFQSVTPQTTEQQEQQAESSEDGGSGAESQIDMPNRRDSARDPDSEPQNSQSPNDARELFNAWAKSNSSEEEAAEQLFGAERWTQSQSPEQELEEGEVAYNYDEWDRELSDTRVNWCRVVEKRVRRGDRTFVELTRSRYRGVISSIKHQFQLMRPESLIRIKNELDGDDYDLDAVINYVADRRADGRQSERIYTKRLRRERDVAVSFLLDQSSSTARTIGRHPLQPYTHPGRRIIEIEKEGLVLMSEALEAVGDAYAIYGFTSEGRRNVKFYVVKDFDERHSDEIERRIGGIKYQHNTRLGAAVRHAAARLRAQEARTRLLIVLSDGRPYDHDYGDARYAREDTREALRQARTSGITPFCITIDRDSEAELRDLYGEVGYTIIDDVLSLPERMPAIYRRLTT
ncbi:MAG TPA: VWA domain-containing protein [Pyrinomonadaceae bacterium]|nr:VWA domain-containing protein [Pyrinomonadaceae bacterium]